MPDSRSLERLRGLLATELPAALATRGTAWGDPKAMQDVLRDIKRSLGGDGTDRPQRDLLVEAVRHFGDRHTVANFKQLKYVCYGVTLPVGPSQWRIIDRSDLFGALLEQVQSQEKNPRQFRRCYQGLLSGYFGFDRSSKPESSANQHWGSLRGFLGRKLDPLLRGSQDRGQMPNWLSTLNNHRNLLQEDPCSRYAEALRQGRTEEMREVCAGLGIENTSWVWEEALMAYVRAVVQSQDARFMAGLRGVLDLVNDRAEWRLPPSVATKATALTVARYARCEDRPEHPVLRDTCLHRIGHPWLERAAWDAHVKHEPARQMIESWLKRRLITDFFKLLAQDGAADLRRLNYWLKWESHISDMWFVLGADALGNRSEAFLDLRKRMVGRERRLASSDGSNNAFIMRIGPLLVIEFGITGNACYAYDAGSSLIDLTNKIFSVGDLKRKNCLARLSHMSGWESRFDREFQRLLGKTVPTRGAFGEARVASAEPSQPGSYGTVHRTAPQTQPASDAPRGEPVARTSTANGSPSGNQKYWPSFSPSNPSSSHPHGAQEVDELQASLLEASLKDRAGQSETTPSNVNRQQAALLEASLQGTSWLERSPPKAQRSNIRPKFGLSEFAILQASCKRHGLEMEDNRHKGGALWVLLPDRSQRLGLAQLLENYGFRYKPGRGFWLEGDD